MGSKWIYMRRVFNSCGRGLVIRAEVGGRYFPDRAYYGYSKREALARYRAEMGLQRQKFNRVEY